MKSISKYGDAIIKISEFTKQLDEFVREEAFKFLLAQEFSLIPDKPSPLSTVSRQEPQDRAAAPQELIRKCNVSSFTDKAVVLAYWLEKYQQKLTFSSADLKSAFEQAREKPPQNASDLVAKLETTGRIMKADKAGAFQNYRLTNTALRDAEGWLNAEIDVK